MFDLNKVVKIARGMHYDDGIKLLVDDLKNSPSIIASMLIKLRENDPYIQNMLQSLVPED